MIKTNPKFQNVVIKFFQKMFRDETFPSDFQNTTLHMVFKGGNMRKDILTNIRFVHCRGFFARVADGLVVENGLKIVKFISVIV